MFGRRRLVPELTSRNGQIRARRRARRPSTCRFRARAADIMKRAMIDVHAALAVARRRRARMILTVHDELLFEVPEEQRRGGRRDRPRPDAGARRSAARAAHRRCRDRRKLEGSKEVRTGFKTRNRRGSFYEGPACQVPSVPRFFDTRRRSSPLVAEDCGGGA